MINRIKSYIKYNSAPIVPLSIFLFLYIVNLKYHFIDNIIEQKIDILIDIETSLIGILLTVLTIYLSFPKSESVKIRMKKSGHNHILLSNVFIGIISFTVSLLVWLFWDNKVIVLLLFMCGLSNTLITGYYIAILSDYS